MRRLFSLGLVGLVGLVMGSLGLGLLSGCAGHEKRVAGALEALDGRDRSKALSELNEELGLKDEKELPAPKAKDAPLLLLERGTVLQSMTRYGSSARDFGVADKGIELLDFSRGAGAELGRYLYSDDSGGYRAPAYEKLLLNTLNLLNYLALHDVQGAKVEARRLAVTEEALRNQDEERALSSLGSYLAGFAFEKAGQTSEALAYYREALEVGSFPSLRGPLRVLTQGRPNSPAIDALVGGAGPLPPPAESGEGELLVVLGAGRVPRKLPERVPIGLALTLVADDIAVDRAQAASLAARGLVTWISYPKLTAEQGAWEAPTFLVDEQEEATEQALDVSREVRASWKKHEGAIIAAAITRTLTRVVAAEAVQRTTQALAHDSGPLGLLLGLLTSGGLAAADTPDTRSWTTLPARFSLGRVRLPAGKHRVELGLGKERRSFEIDMPAGGFVVLPFTTLR